MSSADAVKPPGPFSALRRLDLIYFVLAGFDLLTICAALLLNYSVTTAFEDGVRTSAAWSSRQVDIIQMARLAQDVDAPGNDIFSSQDPDGEEARYVAALAKFETEWTRVNESIVRDPMSPRATHLLEHLAAARRSMDEMDHEADAIFSKYRRGDVAGAGRGMAVMDRAFGRFNESIDQALAVVDRSRTEHLQRQVAYAQRMRSLEFLIATAVLLIVILVATYGMYMGRTLRANQEQRLAMLGEVAASRDRMQRYADDVSHELRGPLSMMRLDAEVLLQHDRSPEQYREGVESLFAECVRLSSVVDTLLFLARADNTAVPLSTQSLDVRKELELIVEFFAAWAEQAQVTFSLDASGTIMADRSLFQRAVSNLITNAMKHTKAGGRIDLRAETRGDQFVIEVSDDGSGIAAESLPHVFDRFYRGPDEPNGDGAGLGLAITRSIMELHGGGVDIQAPPGGGVRATLAFPTGAPAETPKITAL